MQDAAEPGREDAHRRRQAQQPGGRPQAAREARLRIVGAAAAAIFTASKLASCLHPAALLSRPKQVSFLQFNSVYVLSRVSTPDFACVINWVRRIPVLWIVHEFYLMNKEEIFISSSRLGFPSEILATTSSQGAAMAVPHTSRTETFCERSAGIDPPLRAVPVIFRWQARSGGGCTTTPAVRIRL
jgi:hypothetical protein